MVSDCLTIHPHLPPMRCCDAGKRRLLQGLPLMRNVGGHASQRDTSHVIATYALLRAETPFRPYNGANVGGHASQRDTSHVCATYMLLRRRERLRVGASAGIASPPTYRPVGELFGEMSGEVLGRKSGKLDMQAGENRSKLSCKQVIIGHSCQILSRKDGNMNPFL